MAEEEGEEGGNSESVLITRDLLAGLSNHLGHTGTEIPIPFKVCNSRMKDEENEMELKLNNGSRGSNCQSVCTLEKVKTALQTQRCSSTSTSTPTPNNNIRKRHFIDESDEDKTSTSTGNGMMFAAACPSCFMYIMTFTKHPLCPRCNSTVPSFSFPSKKEASR